MRKIIVGILLGISAGCAAVSAQRSFEVSEADGIPVLIKHLPDWENVRHATVFIKSSSELQAAIGERGINDLVDFAGGTEAVTAVYPQGRLLIVEYMTPQIASEADQKFTERLSNDRTTHYRRIGNYSAFVFDAADESAAGALFDQIKYEKIVQWLDKDPTLLQRAERAFVLTTTDIFISTVIVIILGMSFSIVAGFISGLIFFRIREHRRAGMDAFSDAGGMTRLNLDQLTPDIPSERLLKD